jgi:hypothetical protein
LKPEDEKQQEEQLQELLNKGVVEEYVGTEFPKFCSPTFMVPKRAPQ